jgi:hypothetical protein
MKGFEMVSWADILGGSGGDPLANFGEQYFFTNPRMETGAGAQPRAEYRVYRIANSSHANISIRKNHG